MCIEANHFLSSDMKKALSKASHTEKSELGKKILNQLEENNYTKEKKYLET